MKLVWNQDHESSVHAMSKPGDDTQRALNDSHDDRSRSNPMKVSAAYTQSHIIEDLHPAFVDSGLSYDERSDSFAADIDDVYDEAALFDSQRAFTKALETFQQGVQSKYKSKVDLEAHHDWNEVMAYANDARAEYLGAGQRGIMKKINHRLKTFQTAAPAIEAWLKLLPSTSIYGSVVCGGLTIILEVLVELSSDLSRKLIASRQQSISDSYGRRP